MMTTMMMMMTTATSRCLTTFADFDRDMGKTMAPSGSPRQWWKKDAEGADAAPEEIVVTPHGHEE